MNKLKLDPLENEFSRLKNLEDFAEDSVWQGINEGLNKEEKKKKRILVLFFTLSIATLMGIIGWLNYPNYIKPQSEKNDINLNQLMVDKKATNIKVENNYKPILEIKEINKNNSEKAISKLKQMPFQYISKPFLIENNLEIAQGILENEKLNINEIKKLATKVAHMNLEFTSLQLLKTKTQEGVPSKYYNSIEIVGGKSILLNPNKNLTSIGSQWNAGFNFAKSLNKKLIVSLGLNFEAYHLKGTSFTDKPNSYVTDSILAINHKREIFYYKYYDTAIVTTSTDFKRQVLQIALPVGIRYKVFEKNKFNLELKGDVILGYNLSKKEVFNTTRGTKLLASQYTDCNQFSHKINFRLGAGLRFNYTVYKQNSVFISPTVSYALGAMKNTLTQNAVNPIFIGLQAGVCKKF